MATTIRAPLVPPQSCHIGREARNSPRLHRPWPILTRQSWPLLQKARDRPAASPAGTTTYLTLRRDLEMCQAYFLRPSFASENHHAAVGLERDLKRQQA